MNLKGVHFITEATEQYSHQQLAAIALEAGIKVIQYRCKNGSKLAMMRQAHAILGLCRAASALLVINDHLDIALAVGAQAIHLGQDDLPVSVARQYLGAGAIIGVSVQNVAQARQAHASGANYLGYGPVFATSSKADAGHIKGLATLTEFCQQVQADLAVPVVALGGVTQDNISYVRQAGAQGVAVISAISRALNPQRAAQVLWERWESGSPRA